MIVRARSPIGLLGLACATVVLGSATTATDPAGAAAVSAQITTPSRNIGCYASSSGGWYLRCDIRTHTYRTPARPTACDLEYGDSLSLRRQGPARWTCHGDTTLPPTTGSGFKTLAYGTRWRWGPFECRSETTGLRCVAPSGHGFVISKQRTAGTYSP